MANTDVVLQGVKDYTLELLGTSFRDAAASSATAAASSATRSESAATRSEGAADSATGDAAATAADRVATGEDRAQTGRDAEAAEGWASQSKDAATLAITAAATVTQYVGDGFPEGKVTAPVGSIYTDRQATAGAVRWIKTSGSGATGWKVQWGDTGNRNMLHIFEDGATGAAVYRRINDTVTLVFDGVPVTANTRHVFTHNSAPLYRHAQDIPSTIHGQRAATATIYASNTGEIFVGPNDAALRGHLMWLTAAPWPMTLPGTPL